jgi:hypothetical protein
VTAADWATRIREARLRGVDLMAEMTAADWAEYRAQCQASRDSAAEIPEGRVHRERRLASIERQRRRLLDEQQVS